MSNLTEMNRKSEDHGFENASDKEFGEVCGSTSDSEKFSDEVFEPPINLGWRMRRTVTTDFSNLNSSKICSKIFASNKQLAFSSINKETILRDKGQNYYKIRKPKPPNKSSNKSSKETLLSKCLRARLLKSQSCYAEHGNLLISKIKPTCAPGPIGNLSIFRPGRRFSQVQRSVVNPRFSNNSDQFEIELRKVRINSPETESRGSDSGVLLIDPYP